jgi:hypothetical protein
VAEGHLLMHRGAGHVDEQNSVDKDLNSHIGLNVKK